jgi:hypothetical protein
MDIGREVFSFSKLGSIIIPRSVEKLGTKSFSGCEYLQTVTFESGSKLRKIGRNAFYGCSIAEIEIPQNCTFVTGLSFRRPELPINITIHEENENFIIKNETVFNKQKDTLIRYFGRGRAKFGIPNCIETISDGCFYE